MMDSAPKASALPDGWAVASFGELNSFRGGTVNPATRPDEDFELYSVPSFPTGRPERLPGRAIGSTKQTVSPGDVLVCKINPRINRVWTVGPRSDHEQIASSEWIGFRSDALVPRFAKHYFSEPSFRSLLCSEVSGVGGSLTRAQPSRVAEYPVTVAPLPEQIRIADQLDTLLARIQSCQDRLEAIPSLLKRFRKAVLDAAVTGSLSWAWRDSRPLSGTLLESPSWATSLGLHALPSGWRWARFADLLGSLRSGTSAVPSNSPTLYPVLRSSSVRPMGINLGDVRYLASLQKARADDLLAEGDLLFTRLSGSLEYVANCVFVRGLGERRIYYPDRLFRARLKDPDLGRYVELCFSSSLLRRHLTVESKSTAGHQRISMGAIRDFPIPLPEREEQLAIVEAAATLLSLAERIEQRLARATSVAHRLAPLTLAKAFRGELIPQNPSDEPANELLARIAAIGSASGLAGRARPLRAGRPPRSPKETAAMTKSRQDGDVMGNPYLAGHLRRIGKPTSAEALFKVAELPVADFYKQLDWEVRQGHVKDNQTTLEPGHATG
jgi:type I restriction enzyme S subunit